MSLEMPDSDEVWSINTINLSPKALMRPGNYFTKINIEA